MPKPKPKPKPKKKAAVYWSSVEAQTHILYWESVPLWHIYEHYSSDTFRWWARPYGAGGGNMKHGPFQSVADAKGAVLINISTLCQDLKSFLPKAYQ
jgi:hypothetical protein